jgi:hypothetical protein
MSAVRIVGRDGSLQISALQTGSNRIEALPGLGYRLALAQPLAAGADPVITRSEDDLVVTGLPDDRVLILEGFFRACSSAEPCEFFLEDSRSVVIASILPDTRPLGALSDGRFLMYGPALRHEAGEATSGSDGLLKLGATIGIVGLGLAGASAGGGSSSSADSTPPDAPRIINGPVTSRSQPVFGGSAEAGSTVTLTIFADSVSTWQTRASAEGTWRIDTAQELPAIGSPVILREGVTVEYRVVATDSAGNRSPAASSRITLDSSPLQAPTILALPENSEGGINALEAADGTVIIVSIAGANAAAGDFLLIEAGGVLLASQVLTDNEIQSGTVSVAIAAQALRLLGDGESAWLARLVDPVGLVGPASSSFVVNIDRNPPSNSLLSVEVLDDQPPGRGPIPDGGTTDDRTPTLLITLETVLEAGESLFILRSDGGLPSRQVGTASLDRGTTYGFTDAALLAGVSYVYSASISDAAGNITPLDLSRALIVA